MLSWFSEYARRLREGWYIVAPLDLDMPEGQVGLTHTHTHTHTHAHTRTHTHTDGDRLREGHTHTHAHAHTCTRATHGHTMWENTMREISMCVCVCVCRPSPCSPAVPQVSVRPPHGACVCQPAVCLSLRRHDRTHCCSHTGTSRLCMCMYACIGVLSVLKLLGYYTVLAHLCICTVLCCTVLYCTVLYCTAVSV